MGNLKDLRLGKRVVHYTDGGHVYWEPSFGRWVAVNYIRTLGRFETKTEALTAVAADYRAWKEQMR
jgi:hypothetical protein